MQMELKTYKEEQAQEERSHCKGRTEYLMWATSIKNYKKRQDVVVNGLHLLQYGTAIQSCPWYI